MDALTLEVMVLMAVTFGNKAKALGRRTEGTRLLWECCTAASVRVQSMVWKLLWPLKNHTSLSIFLRSFASYRFS